MRARSREKPPDYGFGLFTLRQRTKIHIFNRRALLPLPRPYCRGLPSLFFPRRRLSLLFISTSLLQFYFYFLVAEARSHCSSMDRFTAGVCYICVCVHAAPLQKRIKKREGETFLKGRAAENLCGNFLGVAPTKQYR